MSDAFAGASRMRLAVLAQALALAATPTFALMALAAMGDDRAQIICGASAHGSPLAGMAPMYLLMSVFHLRPWLRLGVNPEPRFVEDARS